MEVLRITDTGGDVLLVEGVNDAGEVVTATGWVSATTSHYPAGSYNPQGNLKGNAQPRRMTPAELNAYAAALLQLEASPAPTAPTVLYATPNADERLKKPQRDR